MSKKIIFSIIIFLLTIIILYVSLHIPQNGTLSCTYRTNQNNLNIDVLYQASFKNKIVLKLATTETVQSSDYLLLESYKTSLENMYSPYKKIKYYDNEITLTNNKLTSKTTINYQKISTSQLIALDKNNKNLIKDGQININDLKKMYQNMGAKCKYH